MRPQTLLLPMGDRFSILTGRRSSIHREKDRGEMRQTKDEDAEQRKKSEKYWGQRQNGWAGAVTVGRGGNGGQ